ncbi:Zinc finger CCHC domain-containing protein 3, partial [Scomber scombrus]
QCLQRFEQKKVNNTRLASIELTALSEREPKAVTVVMYSEKVTTQDINTWLSYHCSVIRNLELRDEDGGRMGARRFYVRLRREGISGVLHHLPSTIQLGLHRGHIFYPGQPKTCRKCGSPNHLASNYNAIFCRNCQSTDHNSKDCDKPMRCNLCSSSGHTFRSCPQSYANRARQSTSAADTLFLTIAEAQPPPEGPGPSNLNQSQVILEQTNVETPQEPTNSQASIETCISQDLQTSHHPSVAASESKREDGMSEETRNEDNNEPAAEEHPNQPALPSTEPEGTIDE